MSITNEMIFLAVIVLSVVFGYFFINKFHLSPVKRFQLIISFLGSLSAVLITYNIYVTIKFNKRNAENQISQNTLSNVQSSFLSHQRELLDRYPESYFLYASMNQDIDLSNYEPTAYDPVKRKMLEFYYAVRIYQAVEDFLSFSAYDITGTYVWLNNFLGWLQSPILQSYWKEIEFNYYEDTRDLVPQIIEKANDLIALRKKKGKLTTQDYDAISKKMAVTYRVFAHRI